MLGYRLLFGTLMVALLAAAAGADGWIDGVLATSGLDGGPVRGTVLCVIIALLVIPAQLELSRLAAAKGLKLFVPVCIVASILFATFWWWPQIVRISPAICILFLWAFVLMALFVYQYFNYGTSSVLGNCGLSSLAICYIGVLSSFVPAIRIEFGLRPVLMFIMVVKSADIGAYAVGKPLGRRKFSPRISPKKTWAGMGGAVAGAATAALLFATIFDIMAWWLSIVFGLCFAFIGQMGDLAESMMKRDAERKDSGSRIPGFGGILDVIDSLLVAAPFSYLFFLLSC